MEELGATRTLIGFSFSLSALSGIPFNVFAGYFERKVGALVRLLRTLLKLRFMIAQFANSKSMTNHCRIYFPFPPSVRPCADPHLHHVRLRVPADRLLVLHKLVSRALLRCVRRFHLHIVDCDSDHVRQQALLHRSACHNAGRLGISVLLGYAVVIRLCG